MNTEEAQTLLVGGLAPYRGQSYVELQRLLSSQDVAEVVGPSGKRYQLEIEAVWDDEEGGALRVLAHIDDGGGRALAPLTDAFIMAPNSRFLGE
jgi:hypothetical protein